MHEVALRQPGAEMGSFFTPPSLLHPAGGVSSGTWVSPPLTSLLWLEGRSRIELTAHACRLMTTGFGFFCCWPRVVTDVFCVARRDQPGSHGNSHKDKDPAPDILPLSPSPVLSLWSLWGGQTGVLVTIVGTVLPAASKFWPGRGAR